jgi:hypothetical protein
MVLICHLIKLQRNCALVLPLIQLFVKIHKKTSAESTTYKVNFCNKTLKLSCNLLKNCVQ